MKKSRILIAAAIVMGITCAFTTKSKKIMPGAYRSSGCAVYPLPTQCATIGSVVCTVLGYTYYQHSGCLDVFYIKP